MLRKSIREKEQASEHDDDGIDVDNIIFRIRFLKHYVIGCGMPIFKDFYKSCQYDDKK